MSDTIPEEFTKIGGPLYADIYGEPLWLRPRRDKDTGEARVSIEDARDVNMGFWVFSTAEIREIAASLIFCADLADKECEAISAGRRRPPSPDGGLRP